MLHYLSYKESDTFSTDANKHFASPIGNERDTPCIYSQHKASVGMHSQHDGQVVRKNCLRTLKEKNKASRGGGACLLRLKPFLENLRMC